MTLLDTERLARKISELLQGIGSPDLAPKLAADYAAACHAANLRLQQCEAMIKAGDRQQAIQLAETAPNLLDLITALEFRGADEWRNYCQASSLPKGDRIDGHAVQALNECYAQGISTDHPLYAVYRQAVLNRNDDDSLKALQTIARLNPGDANAASELARLDAKVLAARLEHLNETLQDATPAVVVAAIEAIEAFGFKAKLAGDIWSRAQGVRCAVLVEETAQLQTAGRWFDALAKLDFIHWLAGEFQAPLPPATAKKLGELDAWAQGEQEKDRKERHFRGVLAELQGKIQASEEKDTSARYVQLPELKDDFEALNKAWRAVGEFARPVPEELAAAFRKRSGLLEGEIGRRTAIRRRIIFGVSAVILAMGAGAAWLAQVHRKNLELNRQLEAAVSQRQVLEADKLLEQAKGGRLGDASTIAQAETFSRREHELLANFESALGGLPTQFPAQPEPAALAAAANQLGLAHAALDALAPELKAANQPRLEAFEGKWKNYLAESASAMDTLLRGWLDDADRELRQVDYGAPPEQAEAHLKAASSILGKIDECKSGLGRILELSPELVQKSEHARSSYDHFSQELGKYQKGLASLDTARSAADYGAAIKLIAASEFTGSSASRAASAVQSLDWGDEPVLRWLLGATNDAAWSYAKSTPAKPFVPEAVMPAERQAFEEMNADPAIGPHFHYRIPVDQTGGKTEEWITVAPLVQAELWQHVKAWTVEDGAPAAEFTTHDYWYFNDEIKLTPKQVPTRLETVAAPEESLAYQELVAGKIVNGDAYANPLLPVLDAIKDSGSGSALFRAYLFLRLTDLMNLQAEAWGLSFCPAAQAHAAQMRSLVKSDIASGDWFVPAKVRANADKLEQFFASARPVGYLKQARGLLAAWQLPLRDQLRYVGYVGLDGKPRYTDEAAAGEVFGFAANQRQPAPLAAKLARGQPLSVAAAPLSPLYALPAPAAGYLAKAGIDPHDPAFQNCLPPLYRICVAP